MKHILSIVGARPQFIKAAALSNQLRKRFKETLVHTGQHYDLNMSDVFFKQLNINAPDYNLEVGSGRQGRQTGHMIEKIEDLLLTLKPDWVLVYGDTNSTLAGSLAALKLHIPTAHVEAGLRSFNMIMPEEVNRIVADRFSKLLFVPTPAGIENLKKEGITEGIHHVGDIMHDLLLQSLPFAEKNSFILNVLKIQPDSYYLATIHRAENTDNPDTLQHLIEGLTGLDKQVILPLHPRTKKAIKSVPEKIFKKGLIKIIEPVGYYDMLVLEKNASAILTDSGGVQKEAYILKRPCITLRTETEWIETKIGGWNQIVGTSPEKITKAVNNKPEDNLHSPIFGDGNSAELIAKILDESDKK